MLEDLFHYNLEDEALVMSSTDVSTCSTCTTEVTINVTSKSEVE